MLHNDLALRTCHSLFLISPQKIWSTSQCKKVVKPFYPLSWSEPLVISLNLVLSRNLTRLYLWPGEHFCRTQPTTDSCFFMNSELLVIKPRRLCYHWPIILTKNKTSKDTGKENNFENVKSFMHFKYKCLKFLHSRPFSPPF